MFLRFVGSSRVEAKSIGENGKKKKIEGVVTGRKTSASLCVAFSSAMVKLKGNF